MVGSPGCPARASRRSRSARCTPRRSAGYFESVAPYARRTRRGPAGPGPDARRGPRPALQTSRHVLADSKSERMRERALRFVEDAPCPECHGSGLRPEALAVTFAGRSIAEVNALPFTEVVALLRPSPSCRRRPRGRGPDLRRPGRAGRGAARPGLGYLSLGRSSTRRPVRRSGCASHPAAVGLFGVVYVLDEPSAGCTRPTRSRCSTCWTA